MQTPEAWRRDYKWLSLGLAAGVVLALAGGHFGYRALRADTLATLTDALRERLKREMTSFRIPDEEREAVLRRMDAFADEVRAGHLGYRQTVCMANRVVGGPVEAAIRLRGFVTRDLPGFHLPPEQERAAQRQIDRILHGLLEGSISTGQALSLCGATENRTAKQKQGEGVLISGRSTWSDFAQMLESARRMADAAAIPDFATTVRIPAFLDRALRAGRQDARTNTVAD